MYKTAKLVAADIIYIDIVHLSIIAFKMRKFTSDDEQTIYNPMWRFITFCILFHGKKVLYNNAFYLLWLKNSPKYYIYL